MFSLYYMAATWLQSWRLNFCLTKIKEVRRKKGSLILHQELPPYIYMVRSGSCNSKIEVKGVLSKSCSNHNISNIKDLIWYSSNKKILTLFPEQELDISNWITVIPGKTHLPLQFDGSIPSLNPERVLMLLEADYHTCQFESHQYPPPLQPFSLCKKIMLERGEIFLKELVLARGKVAKLASTFIVDDCVILTHSRSRVVRDTMTLAAKQNKRFSVYVTKSSPNNSGEEMARELQEAGIKCTEILDSAVGCIMENVDMVMVGAEGIVESGGIINKVGSFTMAVCAREMKKPVYVLTESFKFSRLYPLNQQDLPKEYKYKIGRGTGSAEAHPLVDYTPPAYISLLFTDLGILTPSAVSDELIKLYL